MGYCDDHHPLGEVHAPDLRLPACVNGCHPVENERQRRAGIALEHDQQHPFAEKLWAFDSNLSDLLVLAAYHNPRLGMPEARVVERSAVALGRLADKALRSAGETGIQGPDPRQNALRIAKRRRSRKPDRSFPSRPHRSDPEADSDRMRAIFSSLARAIAAMPRIDGWDEMRRVAELIADNIERLFQRYDELKTRRPDLLNRCLTVGLHHRQVGTEALESVESLDDDGGEIAPLMCRYAAYIKRCLAFAVELCEACNADEADAALGRFAAAVLAR